MPYDMPDEPAPDEMDDDSGGVDLEDIIQKVIEDMGLAAHSYKAQRFAPKDMSEGDGAGPVDEPGHAPEGQSEESPVDPEELAQLLGK